MIARFEKLVDRVVQRSIDNERAFVENPDRVRYLHRRDSVLALLAFGSIIASSWLPDDSALHGAAVALVGGFVGTGLFVGVRRAGTYRSGWLAGRATMIESMSESMRNGETPDEWLRGEFTRDMLVMGIVPKHRQSDEDDASRDDDDGAV